LSSCRSNTILKSNEKKRRGRKERKLTVGDGFLTPLPSVTLLPLAHLPLFRNDLLVLIFNDYLLLASLDPDRDGEAWRSRVDVHSGLPESRFVRDVSVVDEEEEGIEICDSLERGNLGLEAFDGVLKKHVRAGKGVSSRWKEVRWRNGEGGTSSSPNEYPELIRKPSEGQSSRSQSKRRRRLQA